MTAEPPSADPTRAQGDASPAPEATSAAKSAATSGATPRPAPWDEIDPVDDPLRPDARMAPPRDEDEARRQARRRRAQEMWESDLAQPGARFRAWMSMLFADHGFLRFFYLNLHPVGAHAFRSAQPLPHQIDRLARQGLRGVISLRGGVLHGSFPLEREACQRNGLAFRRAVVRSRGLPTREELDALRALIRTAQGPILFHCKSGADRAGFMAALWMVEREQLSAREAADQLSLRFGHVSRGPTGVLDRFFAEAAEAEAQGMPFDQWAREVYDPVAMAESYKAESKQGLLSRMSGWITDKVLRRE